MGTVLLEQGFNLGETPETALFMLPRLLLCICLIFTCQGDKDSLDAGNNSEDVYDEMYNTTLSEDEINHLMYDPDLFEGDIILDPEDTESRNLIRFNKWDNGIVFYTLDGRLSRYQKQKILEAMQYLEKRTCLRFQERTNERYYRSIRLGDRGCSSHVGQRLGDLKLSRGCFGQGTIIHELMHTIGLYHEQSRFDRDEYIDINWHNIENIKHRHNFNKHVQSSTSLMNSPYDCDSIMHYAPDAFARGNTKTITPRNLRGCSPCNPRRRDTPTVKDLQKINTLYQCYMAEHCKQTCKWCDYQLDNCQDTWPEWCSGKSCNKNNWMKIDCRKSCGL